MVLPLLQGWLQRLVDARHEELFRVKNPNRNPNRERDPSPNPSPNPSQDLFRVKGVLAVHGYEHRFVMHGVHAQLQGLFDRAWREGEERASTLVLIGNRLDQLELQRAFDACLHAAAGGCEDCGDCDEPAHDAASAQPQHAHAHEHEPQPPGEALVGGGLRRRVELATDESK